MAVLNPFTHILSAPRASVQTLTNQYNFSVGTTSTQLLPANGKRAYLLVQNNSNFRLYLYFGTTPATATNGLLLQAGQIFEPKKVPIQELQAISNQPGASVIILEGN